MELVAPAGSLAALKAAVEAGADAVYLGLKNATNARNFAGLNFTEADIRAGVAYAHSRNRQVLFAINTFVQPGRGPQWRAGTQRQRGSEGKRGSLHGVVVTGSARRMPRAARSCCSTCCSVAPGSRGTTV